MLVHFDFQSTSNAVCQLHFKTSQTVEIDGGWQAE